MTSKPETAATVTTALGETFTFEDTFIPVVTRTSNIVNPFAGKVAELKAHWDATLARSKAAVTFTVATSQLDRVQRQIGNAGKDAGVSMRQVKTAIDGNDTQVKLTFWAVDKITRPRPDKGTDPTNTGK